MRLAGKVILITGAGTGIGRACALLFARQGGQIGLVGRRLEPLQRVASEILAQGGEAVAISADVTRAGDVQLAVDSTLGRFGKLNIVINNAGAAHTGTIEETLEEEFDHLLNTNLKSTVLVSRAAIPELRKAGGGSIVNIGSFLGLVALRDRAVYCAAKGGVTQLTRAMALDHAGNHIRVNCICPGPVETEMFAARMAQHPDPDAERRRRIALVPLNRIGQPEDVAYLALYLASDESSWMTGVAIPLDGGVTAG